ncbi:Dehydroquinase [Aulographum hederae CBS 113979]|uniref:Catabolic 3-dehydroquinase n=1 Tax=Aulographum hederae CBS 113979 TaxID=1176131 RepID=A0A6G1H1G4_9PEZI|nr:Dehydroquinase [Aulographum hederae CBS 113979]
MAKQILLINGANLQMLGTREPAIYGSTTLSSLESSAIAHAASLGSTLTVFQSNWEGAIIDKICSSRGLVDAIIINPGAFTHTSVAIRDAFASAEVPFVEVHISNIHAREAFRHTSYLSDKAVAVVCGLGVFGYTAAIEFVVKHLKVKEREA